MKKSTKIKRWDTMKRMGKMCQDYRKKAEITQKQVAQDLGVTAGLISQFECGMIDSLYIFIWYLSNLVLPNL